MSDIWARVDEAIDTDPLQIRGIVTELLARAEQAEAELAEARADVEIGDEKIGELNGITVRLEKRAAHWKGRNEQAEAAVERVRDLCHQPYTAAYDLAADVLAELPCRPGNAPESNTDAPSPVTAATEAQDG